MENTPPEILGEANYKKWLNGVDPDNFLNRQVSLLGLYVFIWRCGVIEI